MAEEFLPDSVESTSSNQSIAPTNPNREPVTIMIIGSQWAVNLIIHTLFRLGFAQVTEWSKLQIEPTTRKFMSVLIRYVQGE
ncbi:MAG: hypothetical protein HC881_07545 [Leptolyngbyaceae cyanobacterium SL_7_1]|nr:hypothetical protein [Leptolyngbyaceae cyanobacterium SL_7_1]